MKHKYNRQIRIDLPIVLLIYRNNKPYEHTDMFVYLVDSW